MGDNGDLLRRNRAMSARERNVFFFSFLFFSFFRSKGTSPRMGFSRDVREWEAVIVCTHCDNTNALHVRTLHGIAATIGRSTLATWRNTPWRLTSIISLCNRWSASYSYSKSFYRNSANRCYVSYAFSILRSSSVEYRKMRKARVEHLSWSLVSNHLLPLFNNCKKVSLQRLYMK